MNADMPEGPNGPHWYTQFIGIRATNEFKLSPVKRNIGTTDLKTATILTVDDMAMTMIVYVEYFVKETKRSPCLDTLGLFSWIKASRISPSYSYSAK